MFGANFIRGQRKFFDDIKKYSTPEQIASYDKILNFEVEHNLENLDNYIFAPMFGYASAREYWQDVSSDGQLH